MKIRRQFVNIIELIVVLAFEFLIGTLFEFMGLSEIHIFTIYIVGMLVAGLLTESIICTVGSVSGLLIFNYFFAEPISSFKAKNIGYPMTFIVILVSATVVGWMARRNAEHLKIISGNTERRQIIVDTSRQLIAAKGKQEIIEITAERMIKMTGMSVVMFVKEEDEFLKPQIFLAPGKEKLSFEITEEEMKAVKMVYSKNSYSEEDIRLLERCNGFYLKIRTVERKYGVIGLDFDGQRLEYKRTTLALGECALAFERDYLNQKRQEVIFKAKNQKLRSDLLRSISHDLRTPLTGIGGNAALLMNETDKVTRAQVKSIGKSIWEECNWLSRQVENVLSITKLDEIERNIVVKPELLEDILMNAVEYAIKYHTQHHFNLVLNEQLHVVSCNAQLINQVLRNLFDNAARYTKEGSIVTITIQDRNKDVIVRVEDNGDGIPEHNLNHLFDLFYTTENAGLSDTQRGFGIGLALCKTIVETHGGTITVENAVPHGAIFTFSVKKAR